MLLCFHAIQYLEVKGGFQLLDLIIPELKSHVIPYKFKSSHWLNGLNVVISTNERT